VNIEHCAFLSWFLASPKAMSKTARSCLRGAGSNSVWRSCHGVSNLALLQEAILIGSCQIAGRAYRRRLNRANAFLALLYETRRAYAPRA
jgi:hypothetical protein